MSSKLPGKQATAAPAVADQAISPTVKRLAVFTAAAALSTWAIDMAATQVGLPTMQSTLGISVTASQWILNITLMLLAGLVTVAKRPCGFSNRTYKQRN